MLAKQAFVEMKDRLFCLLERYPEEMREILMTDDDKANANAAAFFAHEVAYLKDLGSKERTDAVIAYIETVWMAGFEAGREKSRENSNSRKNRV